MKRKLESNNFTNGKKAKIKADLPNMHVINRKCDHERYSLLINKLVNQNFPRSHIRRINAVNGHNHCELRGKIKEFVPDMKITTQVKDTEVATALSHLVALEEIVQDGKMGIIVEDDLIPLYGEKFWDELIRRITVFKIMNDNESIFLLYYSLPKNKKITKIKGQNELVRINEFYVTIGYVVPPKVAEKIIQEAKSNWIHNFEPYDCWLGKIPWLSKYAFNQSKGTKKLVDHGSIRNNESLSQSGNYFTN